MNPTLAKGITHALSLLLLIAAYFLYGAHSAGAGGPVLAGACLVLGVALEFGVWYRWTHRRRAA